MPLAVAIALSLVAPAVETLEWNAAAGCPDAADVRARIEARLGRPLPAADDEDAVRARATIATVPDGFSLELAIESNSGARTRALHSRDCEVLAQTTALLVAVAIDPRADENVEPSHDAPADDPPVAEAEPVAAPTPARPASTPPRREPPSARVRGALRFAGGAAFGPLPGIAPAIDATAALLYRRARVEAGFAWLFDRSSALAESGGEARLRMWTVAVRGCWVPTWRWFELPICGGAAAGARLADTRTASGRPQDSAPWIALEAGTAAVFVPARPIALRLGVDLVVPVNRAELVLEGRTVAHDPTPVGARGLIGVEARFP